MSESRDDEIQKKQALEYAVEMAKFYGDRAVGHGGHPEKVFESLYRMVRKIQSETLEDEQAAIKGD